MNSQEDYNFQGSYNMIAKNICVGCQMEEQVDKLQNYHNSILEVFVTFSSNKTTKKIFQGNLFNETKSKNHHLSIKDKNGFIDYLVQYQEELINDFFQQQQPVEEVVLILNSTE